MYTIDDRLKSIPYFDNKNLSDVLDQLTKTVRRGHMTNYVKSLIDCGTPFSLLFLDIDNFKRINDGFGHQAGDEILVDVSSDLVEVIGASGVVGRFGGDEFLIVLENMIDYDWLWKMLSAVQKKVFRKDVYIGIEKLTITATIGVVRCPVDGDTLDELLKKSDKALYRGKQKGRNCFIIYNELMHSQIDTSQAKSNDSLATEMAHVYSMLAFAGEPMEERMLKMLNNVCKFTHINAGYFVSPENKLFSNDYSHKTIPYQFIRHIYKDNVKRSIPVVDFDNLIHEHKELHEFCFINGIRSFYVVPIHAYNKHYGFLVFVDNERRRIWQADDSTLFTYAGTIASLVWTIEDYKF